MKKGVLIWCVFLFLQRSAGQDYRILQADKNKVFVTTSKTSDSTLRISIINAAWRIDFVKKCVTCKTATDAPDTAFNRPKRRPAHVVSVLYGHHYADPYARTFYTNIGMNMSVNEIITVVNNEYRNLIQMGDADYRLIKEYLPDTAVEYYVDGYRGKNSATLEIMYLWGAPPKDWSIGFSMSVNDREARKILSSLLCIDPDEGELEVRKIKLRQSNLLSVMSYANMFCP